jgi:hypothetical protein
MPPEFVYTLPEAAMFLAVLAMTALITALAHMAFNLGVLRHMIASIGELSPGVVAFSATIFTLSVTFLANSIWQNEQRARETVRDEARNIRVIETYAEAMVGPAQESFRRIIFDYGDAVAEEWPTMAGSGGSDAAEAELANLYRAALHGLAEGDHNRLLQQRILVALDALSAARQQRLTLAREVVSAGQWFMVVALALLLIVVMALSHGSAPGARAAALGIVTVAVSVALFVIIAHDRPFVGYLAIPPKAILEAARGPSA